MVFPAEQIAGEVLRTADLVIERTCPRLPSEYYSSATSLANLAETQYSAEDFFVGLDDQNSIL